MAVQLAAYAEARGPDSLGLKASRAPVSVSDDGVTTLGCSGVGGVGVFFFFFFF